MTINIFFKNVHQGDTIIIDWQKDNLSPKKFGLIDCNLVNGEIHYLKDHIIKNKITTFEFVLMSHPHTDHFSGFLKFIDFCKSNNILIKKFIHTSVYDPNFLKQLLEEDFRTEENKRRFIQIATSSVNREIQKKRLLKLFKQLAFESDPSKSGLIGNVFVVNNDYPIPLDENVFINFIAPYSEESQLYVTKSYKQTGDGVMNLRQKTENNPHANLMSSLLQISCPDSDWQILLCSDITKAAFERILLNPITLKTIQNKSTIAFQMPHHGSVHNHKPEFWKKMKNLKSAYALLSVGDGYGHPDAEVVSFFREHSKEIHATNCVGGLNEIEPDRSIEDFLNLLSLPEVTFSREGMIPPSRQSDAYNFCEKHLVLELKEGNIVRYFVNDVLHG